MLESACGEKAWNYMSFILKYSGQIFSGVQPVLPSCIHQYGGAHDYQYGDTHDSGTITMLESPWGEKSWNYVIYIEI